jgi:hypothetical protein
MIIRGFFGVLFELVFLLVFLHSFWILEKMGWLSRGIRVFHETREQKKSAQLTLSITKLSLPLSSIDNVDRNFSQKKKNFCSVHLLNGYFFLLHLV